MVDAAQASESEVMSDEVVVGVVVDEGTDRTKSKETPGHVEPQAQEMATAVLV